MVKYKVVFTLNDASNLRRDLNWSLPTVGKFVKKEDIIIFVTPPVTYVKKKQKFRKQWLQWMKSLATVKEVPLISEPFTAFKNRGMAWYGEKVHLCDIDSPNIVFLDCDCSMVREISPIMKGNWDFSAGRDIGNPDLNLKLFKEMFKKIGKEYVPMPNAGFLIFKNYCHKDIKDEWLKLINDKKLPNPHRYANTKEQYCLALAVSGKQIRWMKKEWYLFSGELKSGLLCDHPNLYVLHTKGNIDRALRRQGRAVHGKGWH